MHKIVGIACSGFSGHNRRNFLQAAEMNWPEFDLQFGCYYSDGQGRPALTTRLLAGLHYLKYAHDLSDEATVQQYLENPYWQYFCGSEYFEHELPCRAPERMAIK